MSIRLKQKEGKSGMVSLFIETYKGSYFDENGKRKHIREYEFLKKYLYKNPLSKQEILHNKETLIFANFVLEHRVNEVENNKSILFFDYFTIQMEKHRNSDSNYSGWTSTLKHLKLILSEELLLKDIEESLVQKVRNYFENEARTLSGIPLSNNSKYLYFNKFKQCLRNAVEESLISNDILSKVKSFTQESNDKVYLTAEELQKLVDTDCKFLELKRAFIFSCLTGLRVNEIQNLKWKNIEEIQNSDDDFECKLHFNEKSDIKLKYIYLNKSVRDILGNAKANDDFVFRDFNYSGTYNTEILRWCGRAKISKSISFRNAIWTHGYLLLNGGADLGYLVYELGYDWLENLELFEEIQSKRNEILI